jgi:hypothetical protein
LLKASLKNDIVSACPVALHNVLNDIPTVGNTLFTGRAGLQKPDSLHHIRSAQRYGIRRPVSSSPMANPWT